MKPKCNLMVALSVALSVFAVQADVRNWTGAGDGVNFADSRNWDGEVAPGDSLVIENATADTVLALTNDLGSASEPFRLECITALGAGTVRIGGNPIEPTGSATTNIHAGCTLITDFDIIYPNHSSKTYVYCYVTNDMSWTHNGSISAPGKTALRFITLTGTFNVYGDVTITNGSINVSGGPNYGNQKARWYFYGKCTTPKLCADSGWLVRGAMHLAHECDTDTLTLRCVNTYCDAVNVLKPSSVVESYTGGNDGSVLLLQGYDQTIDRLTSGYSIAKISDAGNRIDGTGSTLTMKCSVDNTTNDFRFVGSVNAVWDPLGDYKCTFRERKHTTSGRITVKRGTMAFLGATEFSALSELEIAAGAKFSLTEITNASPFTALKYIWLENGTTSVIAIPEGCSVSTAVMVGNAPLLPGTYTGAGGTADHVVNWIEGKGVVTVAPASRLFTGAESSRWSNPLNWSSGTLPTNDVETVIAGLNVTVPPADTNFYNLLGFAEKNSTTPSFNIVRGGSITVAGGSLVITNICGKARVGADKPSAMGEVVTSRIDVTSGFLGLYLHEPEGYSYYNCFALGKGGVLSMTGGKAEYRCEHRNNQNFEWMFHMENGGLLDLSGDAEFVCYISRNPAPVFGTGVVNVRDNAKLRFSGSGYARWTPAEDNGTLTVNLSGNAVMNAASCNNYIGGYNYNGAKTVVNVSGNSVMHFSSILYVGYQGQDGASGELNISDNAVVSNQTNYGIFVGRGGTAAKPSIGKIKMTGGYLRPISNLNAKEYGSLNFGCDTATEFTNIYNRGTLEISGGAITNNSTERYSQLVVGAGNAYGEILQSGGTIYQGKTISYVGWRGGIGFYRFTGGTADFSRCDLHVGLDGGKGTLEIGAGTGTLTSKNLFFDGADSVLKFKPGANGSLAKLNVTTMFTVASDAKLVVDASEYVGIRPVELMTFAAKDGNFAEENVEIIAPKPSQFKVLQQAGRIRLIVRKGFMMSVK